MRLVLILAKPYYQNARIDRGIIFGVRRNLANDYQLPVRSVFFGFPSFLFSLYILLIYQGLSADAPPPGAQRRRPVGQQPHGPLGQSI